MKYDFIPDSVSEHTNVYDVLKERGFIEQSTDEEKVRELLQNEKVKFYIGFDPTADCLHVGALHAGDHHDVYAEVWSYAGRAAGRRYWFCRRSFGTDRYASDDDC